jgi:putative hydrolase of the HAD superfamily
MMVAEKPSIKIDLIGFDADDTLWQNEYLYSQVNSRFEHLLSDRYGVLDAAGRLDEMEMHNLQFFGYGIKSFILSMIETAIALTAGQVAASDIQKIVDFARDMLRSEIRLVEGATDTLAQLSVSHRLMLITKGDLFEQSLKVERSGLARYFNFVEIVVDKTPASYTSLLAKYNVNPQCFMMVGNSLRSDIFPVAALGGFAVYVPAPDTWSHESQVEAPASMPQYYEMSHLTELPGLVQSLEKQ